MAIVVRNTNYNGEVLEQILMLASTGNEIVDKGLIDVIPGIEKKVAIPRMKTGKMLQKRKENPTVEDSKGDFNYSEKTLEPHDFMAFTVFNPRTFEGIWRQWQPKGDLVFAQLPPEGQNAMLEALARQCNFELGEQYVNGEYGDDDDHLMNGVITQMSKDNDVIIVAKPADTTMLGRLKVVRSKIPVAIATHPNLRYLMSIADWQQYDDELTARENKNTNETAVNPKMYKGVSIETLASWPDGLIVATLCAPDEKGNLFAAVNLQDDEHVIQIDKVSNASELYFFKLLMKADTNIAFGEETVVLDMRVNAVFNETEEKVVLNKTTLTFSADGGEQAVAVTATGSYSHTSATKGYRITDTDGGVTITADVNAGTADVTGKVVFTLDSDKTKTATLTLTTTKNA